MGKSRLAKKAMRFTKDARLADHRPALELAIQLMLHRDACNSAMYWHELLANSDRENPVDSMAILCTIGGWCGEAVVDIQEGHQAGLVDREMLNEHLDDFPECQETWDAVMRKPAPKEIRLLHKIRGECFGHWDPKVARGFLALIENRPSRFSFIETSDHGTFRNTWYQWGGLAIANHLCQGELSVEAFGDLTKVISEWAIRVISLCNILLDEIIVRTRLPVEEAPIKRD